MNTEPKTYGQICMESYSDCILTGQERWEAAAQAVISAYKERETVEGWRLLEGERPRNGDQAWCKAELKWEDDISCLSNDGTVPIRRRARFLKESHQQDSRQRESEIGGQGDARHSMPPTGSPAGGTTTEGGDTFRAGMDRAIQVANALIYPVGSHPYDVISMLINALKRERDEHRPTQDQGDAPDRWTILRDERDRLKEELAYQQERYTGLCQVEAAIRKDRTACRKELEEAIKHRNSTHDTAKGLFSEADFVIKELRSRLDEAERQLTESTRWIPFSERMPTNEDSDPNGRVVWANHAATIAQCYIVYGAWNVAPIGCTHWMPIPPLPKPQEDDGFEKWFQEFCLASNGGESYRPMARAVWDALASRKEKQKP